MSQQIAVVTGASGGFGAAITLALLDVGYAVAAVDIDVTALQRLEQEIGKPGHLGVFAMDVTDHGSVEQTSGAIAEKMGLPVTVLVNNAGILDRTYCVNDRSQTQSRKVIDVNLAGAFNCTGVFTRSMVRQRYGRVINIASIAGIWGAGGGAAYAASKAGLIKASESWAQELGQFNISVTAIAPGICKTNMSKPFEQEGINDTVADERLVRSIVPVGRWGTPDDVAEVVTFLATCKTNYLNAAVIPMDGGMRVGTL
ncbi:MULTISPECIES: SDR family NAD(P)-dependent oxidoreductase [Rhizobium/Agrobacterium group]|uniref:SDR family NAD(P)-dependent oxidoreductase n=1 Tax=Rhizobium/Agrobacterium group TaxID=227290 RepID=UPI0022FFD321|nr:MULTISPECIES: SDR family NAD(P)-dependent oxidoreductase [Rhizobium/Agrobacterium group]MDA5632838.1 SDR family NAD(P)-dependent oxidoreductase [Agrobacterium sp. ST15.16.024]MDF1888706.1 SDR family NAD(P)-dependent oxidoreductase [Rhizobium rhizogenes]